MRAPLFVLTVKELSVPSLFEVFVYTLQEMTRKVPIIGALRKGNLLLNQLASQSAAQFSL